MTDSYAVAVYQAKVSLNHHWCIFYTSKLLGISSAYNLRLRHAAYTALHPDSPYIRTKYTVSLYPFGEQLWPESIPARITSLAQLQAAIRCIMLALKDLHAANFAHTDIRWPNVIKCSNNGFCLIDLETAVELGCK